MKKLTLVILFFAFTTMSFYSQDGDCNAILKRKLNFDNPKSITDNIKNMKSCGLDSLDIKLFSQGPILGSIIMVMTSNHKNKALTWGDLLEEINHFKKTETYQMLRNSVDLSISVSGKTPIKNKKQAKPFEGIDFLTDYDSGLALSKQTHKPVLIYFNGRYTPVCRMLEKDVNADPNLIKYLKNFIVVSLLVDDPTLLDKPYRTKTGQLIKTIGGKNSDLEFSKFNSNSQPFLALINLNGDTETSFRGYGNTADFQRFLINGKSRWDIKNQ